MASAPRAEGGWEEGSRAAWELIRATSGWLVEVGKFRMLMKEAEEVKVMPNVAPECIESVMAHLHGTLLVVSKAKPRTLNDAEPEDAVRDASRDMRALGKMSVDARLVGLAEDMEAMRDSF